MRKIGFIDYYLSEWHANNYPKWIAQANETLGTDYQVAYAWAECDISLYDGKSSAQWCETYGATLCATLEELCEKSDVLLILATSDPDKHLPYAEIALRYGKPTYIDKTFAPDAATAAHIFALAEQYGTPLFSSSALRYADELEKAVGCTAIQLTGGGRDLAEYIVHPLEMLVKALGTGAKNILATPVCGTTLFRISYADGRCAAVTFGSALPYTFYADCADGKSRWQRVTSDFFGTLLREILSFYESGKPPVDAAQTLEIMKLRDGALAAVAAPEQTITLS